MSADEIKCPKCIEDKIEISDVGELFSHDSDGTTLKIEGCVYCHFHGIQIIKDDQS